ncbi:MAG: hypothetical protein M1821_007828 [Bathelium mastoideum]|nr:MAG: hypothetical protein M1821_007828 [Bathelium mastoideum]
MQSEARTSGSQRQTEAFDEEEIEEESKKLREAGLEQWATRPRLHLLLERIGCTQEARNWLLETGVTDELLPFADVQDLPLNFREQYGSDFMAEQKAVLSKEKAMTDDNFLSKEAKHGHKHITAEDEDRYFPVDKSLGLLVEGSYSQVSGTMFIHGRGPSNPRKLALKRFLRNGPVQHARPEQRHPFQNHRAFQDEHRILKKIRYERYHDARLSNIRRRHIVELLGSYTTPDALCLVLSPVGEDSLVGLLERYGKLNSPEQSDERERIRQWLLNSFGCLAAAVWFLHRSQIRHKDLKPGNVIFHEGKVCLIDFGAAYDFSHNHNPETSGAPTHWTPNYRAPENEQGPRSTPEDVWLLGEIFLDIITVLKGFSLDEKSHFFKSRHGQDDAIHHASEDVLKEWYMRLKEVKSSPDVDIVIDWIDSGMLRREPDQRWTMDQLLREIRKHGQNIFWGDCCGKDLYEANISFKETGIDERYGKVIQEAKVQRFRFDSPNSESDDKTGDFTFVLAEKPAHPVWKTTRRVMVIPQDSWPSNTPVYERWLPLTGVKAVHTGASGGNSSQMSFRLCWSDFNQEFSESHGNYDKKFGRAFQQEKPNQTLELFFASESDMYPAVVDPPRSESQHSRADSAIAPLKKLSSAYESPSFMPNNEFTEVTLSSDHRLLFAGLRREEHSSQEEHDRSEGETLYSRMLLSVCDGLVTLYLAGTNTKQCDIKTDDNFFSFTISGLHSVNYKSDVEPTPREPHDATKVLSIHGHDYPLTISGSNEGMSPGKGLAIVLYHLTEQSWELSFHAAVQVHKERHGLPNRNIGPALLLVFQSTSSAGTQHVSLRFEERFNRPSSERRHIGQG